MSWLTDAYGELKDVFGLGDDPDAWSKLTTSGAGILAAIQALKDEADEKALKQQSTSATTGSSVGTSAQQQTGATTQQATGTSAQTQNQTQSGTSAQTQTGASTQQQTGTTAQQQNQTQTGTQAGTTAQTSETTLPQWYLDLVKQQAAGVQDLGPMTEFGKTLLDMPVNDYMNPYLEQVAAPVLRRMEEDQARQQQELDAQRVARGAFGTSRADILANQMLERQAKEKADTLSGLYSQAFGNAQSNATGDLNRMFQEWQMLQQDPRNLATTQAGILSTLKPGQITSTTGQTTGTTSSNLFGTNTGTTTGTKTGTTSGTTTGATTGQTSGTTTGATTQNQAGTTAQTATGATTGQTTGTSAQNILGVQTGVEPDKVGQLANVFQTLAAAGTQK